MKFLVASGKGVLVFAMAVLMAGCGGGGGSAVDASGAVDSGGGGAVSQGPAGTLIGHVVSTTDFHGAAPDQTTVVGPRNTVVGDGVELTNEFFSGFLTIDLSGASIRITAATNQPFGYSELLRFADANGTISPIASVTVNPATNYAGFDASRLLVTADRIDVNLSSLPGLQGQQILLNITFASP
jgi:hypothetical protein